MSKEFRKEVEKGLSAICDKIGFKKKNIYFVKSMDDNVTAILSFGMATHGDRGRIYVNVLVGVSYKDIEQLHSDLTGTKRSIFQHTTGQQIGYLMPQDTFKEWHFVENANNACVFEDLLKTIKTYAFSYQEKMRHFDNLFQSYKRLDSEILYIRRDVYLPIMYYLMGDKQRGLEAIEEAIERRKQPVSEETVKRLTEDVGPNGLLIIGNRYGGVDPRYLEFVERYKLLP